MAIEYIVITVDPAEWVGQARDQAEAAQAAAETAQTAAATSESAAAASATAAGASATDASSSATAAATSETNAGASATAASASATSSATSATNASDSATAAANSATAAATSETNAGTSATTASTSAGAAATSATAASTSATAAAASATAASTSETNAGNSATAAAASATAAGDADVSAAASKTSAALSESNAAQFESLANTAQLNAQASEANAAGSESNAATSESNASASAAAAAASEATATAQAGIATTKAAEASTSAVTALNAISQAFKGGLAGASVPATSTATGDTYRITSAGTSQSKTWVVGDAAIYNGTSGSWTQLTGFFAGATAYTDTLSVARAPQSGVSFDGVAGYGEISTTLPKLGDANGGVGFKFMIQALPSESKVLFGTGKRVGTFVANTWSLYMNTGGVLVWYEYDSGANPAYGGSNGVLATISLNRVYDIWISRDKTNSELRGYVDGVKVFTIAYTGIDLSSANPVRMMRDSVSAYAGGVVFGAEVANVALTDAEVTLKHRYGWSALPQYAHPAGAGATGYTSDFSAGVDSWVVLTGTSLTGNVDSINGADNWVAQERTGALGALYSHRSGLLSQRGKRQRIRATIYVPVGATYTHVAVRQASGTGAISDVKAVTPGTQYTFDFVATPAIITDGDRVYVGVSTSTGSGFTNTSTGQLLYVRDVIVTDVGLAGSWQFDSTGAGYQQRDLSGGGRPLLLSTSGADRIQRGNTLDVVATVTHGASGNLQLNGQAILPSGTWRLAWGTVTSNAAVTISVGNVSAGAQLVSAQATTATTQPLTIVSDAARIASTVNVWSNASAAATLTYRLRYERIDTL